MANLKKEIKKNKDVNYISRDFDSIRSDLVEYAKTHYPEKIQDFSENGIGGMFIDLAAYVGDSMSFYLNHQFGELNIETAIEEQNIERLIRSYGIKLTGASPAMAEIDISIRVPAIQGSAGYVPDYVYLPKIIGGTTFKSTVGPKFELLDTVDFNEKDASGNYIANFETVVRDALGNPLTLKATMKGVCSSGLTYTEKFTSSDKFKPFQRYALKNGNVVELINVIDNSLNEYYEVESLAQDVVYKMHETLSPDKFLVPGTLNIIPAPYRFETIFSRKSLETSLMFGGGIEDTYDNDVLPDPSEIALPLYGDRKTFSKAAVDPNLLLRNRTLGIAPTNKVLTITYRAGGGLNHNVPSLSINSVDSIKFKFNQAALGSEALKVRNSLTVVNRIEARGGEDPPTLNELRSFASRAKFSQNRIVTSEDLISRIYTMPSNFGRVYRAGIYSSDTNPLASNLYVLSRNSKKQLIIPPDKLKQNLKLFLNKYRLISDAVDIINGSIVNVGVDFIIKAESNAVHQTVLQEVNKRLRSFFKIENFQIGQPLNRSNLALLILSTEGVSSLINLVIYSITGDFSGRKYSELYHPLDANNVDDIVYPPKGGIFELKYPSSDIKGKVK